MYSVNDAKYVIDLLNIEPHSFSLEDLAMGLNVEAEHGSINPQTNITNDDIIITAKIALAHLNEFPNYYNKDYGIKNFEKLLKEKN